MQRYIIVLVLVLVLIILMSMGNNGVEGFTNYFGYFKKYCPSCGWRGTKSCGKCTNCGICTTADGYSSCVPGSSSGPFFRSDCASYEYGDNQTFYNGANVFPIVQMRNIYPYSRWNLNRSLRMPKKRANY